MSMQIISQQSIAEMFGVSRETIDNWQQEGMPVAVRGGPGVPSRYEAPSCINWRIAHELAKLQGGNPQHRIAMARAEKLEMQNAENKGRLVPVALIEPRLKSAVISAREFLRNEPPRLARMAQGMTSDNLEKMLSETFDEFLTALGRMSISKEYEASQIGIDNDDEDQV